MSGYKLTYFNLTGLGEPIRFVLHQSGIKFEDRRLQREEWAQVKPTMPLGQVPVLEIDGKPFTQSKAIARYIARKNNLYGANELEAYEIDATVDFIEDLRIAVGKYHWEENPEQKKKYKAEVEPKIPFTLQKLDEQVKKNGGFLVGGKLSWADLHLTAQLEMFDNLLKTELEKDYPELKKLVAKVRSLPKIKAYLDSRPQGMF